MTNILYLLLGLIALALLTSYPVRAWWHDMRADSDQDELDRRTRDFSSSDIWAANTARMIVWHCDYADALRQQSTLIKLWTAARGGFAGLRSAWRAR
jgi:hypothetical protein